MPRVTLLLNIGSADAVKLGLEHPDETREGATIDVGPKVAEELLKRGWAVNQGEDARAVPTRDPLDPPQQASAAPSGILAAIVEDRGPRGRKGSRADAAAAGPDDADTSPLSEDNADEAIDHISRMRSKDRLQQVVDNDKRVSVQNAARERLKSL